MIWDQKMSKCETIPTILFLGVQKLLKCETVPIILIISTPKLLKCETVPINIINSYSETSRAPRLGVKLPRPVSDDKCIVLLSKSNDLGSKNVKV